MKIRNLIWDEWNVEHTAKHGVSQEEIREYGDFYPISARDMEEKEKRFYKKWLKK